MAKTTQSAWITALSTLFPDAGTPRITASELRESLTNLAHSTQWIGDEPRAPGIITVTNQTTTTPPGSPSDDDAYIVGSGASGAWASQDGKIAIWDANVSPAAWTFYTPEDGWLIWDLSQDGIYRYDTGISPDAWVAFAGATTDADAIHDNVSGEISALSEKASPVSADLVIIEDSAASNAKKKVQVGNLGVAIGTDASGYAILGAVRLTKSSNQTISNASDTSVTWATEVMDPLNTFVVGTSATNINCPTGTAFVEVVAGGEWGSNATGTRQLSIKLNGTVIGQNFYEVDETSYTDRQQVSSGMYPAVATDVVTVTAYQNSGGNLALNNAAPTFVSVKFYG